MSSLCAKDKLVEHGDLLSELKRVQEGLVGGFERELTTPNTLLRSRFLMDRAVTYITENFSRTIYIYILNTDLITWGQNLGPTMPQTGRKTWELGVVLPFLVIMYG